jgi:uroporphyrin-III C-methyltransferase
MNEVVAPAPANPARAKSAARSALLAILLLAVLAFAGYAAWRIWMPEQDSLAAQVLRLQTQVETLQHSLDQQRREADAARTRSTDTDNVNKSLREEVLGITERSRLLEDAVANLAAKNLSGHDALMLNEAELLLVLAQQRFVLFHDPEAASTAYRLADSALTEVDDSAFSGVRQSIGAEIEALTALKNTRIETSLAELTRLRENLSQLPLAQIRVSAPIEDSTINADASRLARIMGQFVRVSHGSEAALQAQSRASAIGAELIALDLRAAEAALLARNADQYTQAIKRARAALATRYDAAHPAVIESLAALDRAAGVALAPPAPPVLGTALKELRNLRVAHALRASKTASKSGDAGT